jgi:hypothetical protein
VARHTTSPAARAGGLALAAALLACPAAAAHGGGGQARGYESTVLGIAPLAPPGIEVEIRDGDDRVRLTNRSGRVLVVLGYEGEPYLRVDSRDVFRNENSPATYLDQDRYARVALPAHADAQAPPRWTKVTAGPTYEWHDHRIHRMNPTPPPAVRAEPGSTRRLFDWRIPLRFDGRLLTITGRLVYRPQDSSIALPVLAALGGGATALALGLLMLPAWRRRRRNG